jgi:hypothetical protein
MQPTAQRNSPAHVKPHSLGHLNVGLLGGVVFFINHLPTDSAHAPNAPQIAYKASVAYLFDRGFEIGTEVGMTGSSPTFGVDLNYFIFHTFFLGVAGAMKITQHGNYEYLGGKMGYEFHLTRQWRVGPEVLYLYNFSGHIEMLETLGAVKYFF